MSRSPVPLPTFSVVSRLTALVAVVLVASCAHSERRPLVREGGVIEVANRTASDYAVYLDGQHAADVHGGARALIDNVPGGQHRLVAQPQHGHMPVLEVTVALPVFGREVWELMPAPPEQPLDVPAGFGDIQLVNGLDRDLVILLDGRTIATMLAGDTRLLPDVGGGMHTVHAKPGRGYGLMERQVEVLPGQTSVVRLDPPRGQVEVVNSAGEIVTILIEGVEAGTIETGDTLVVPEVPAGIRTVEARGAITKRVIKRELRVSTGETVRWTIAVSDGGVEVQNETNETVRVEIDDLEVGRLAPGESREFLRISPGEHVVTATAVSTGFVFRMPVRITTDHVFVWPLSLDEGVLLVENRSTEVMQIYKEDEPFLTLPAGERRYVSQFPAGSHALTAVGQTSHQIVPRTLTIQAARTEIWRISPESASLQVENERNEALRIYIDAEYATELLVGGRVVLEGLVPGERLIEVLGVTTEAVLRERITLEPNVRSLYVAADPRATVTIVNRTGEELRVSPKLRAQGAVVPSGSSYAYEVPVGIDRMVAIGSETGKSYTKDVLLEPGDVMEWEVVALAGSLLVVNHRDEPIMVHADEAPIGTIAAGSSRLLEGLPEGRHDMVAEGVESGITVRAVRVVRSEGANNWEVAHDLGTLVVTNTTGEEVDVTIDDRPYGWVPAGATHVFGGVPAGERVVSFIGRRTHENQESIIQFSEGRIDRYTVDPLRAMLRVVNQRTVPVRVFVDGEHVGDAPAKGEFEGFVTQGQHTVETRTEDTLESTVRRFVASPYQTYEVDVIGPEGDLRATNLTAHELVVRYGDHVLGTVVPGATRRFEGIPAGDTVVRATATGTPWRWELRGRIERGETAEWVVTEDGAARPSASPRDGQPQ